MIMEEKNNNSFNDSKKDAPVHDGASSTKNDHAGKDGKTDTGRNDNLTGGKDTATTNSRTVSSVSDAVKKNASSNLNTATRIASKVYQTAKKISNSYENTMQDKDAIEGYSGGTFGRVILAVFVVIAFCMCGYQNVSPGTVESYRESQLYGSDSSIFKRFLGKEYPSVKKVIEEYNGPESYDEDEPNAAASRLYIKVTDAALTDIFKNAMQEIAKEYSKSYLSKLFSGELKRNDERTLEEFRSVRYPYCRMRADGQYWTIGDFLDGRIPTREESSNDDYLNNDINYAEIISVICLNPNFDIQSENCTLEDFVALLTGKNAKKLLYELSVSDPYYEHYEILTDENGNEILDKETKKPVYGWVDKGQTTPDEFGEDYRYYYKFEIMPYGLRELYMLADVDPMESHVTFPQFSNYEMMDKKEEYLRYFAGTANDELGTSFDEDRSQASIVYTNMMAQNGYATGRSLFYYIPQCTNLEEINLPEWDTEELPFVAGDYEFTDGECILPMPQYINQGDFPNVYRGGPNGNRKTTVKSSGCIDCCYAMVAAYYTGKNVDMAKVGNNKKYYNGSAFNHLKFNPDYGMKNSALDKDTEYNVLVMRDYLRQGYPLIIHIKGYWKYNGKTLHGTQNGHFIVIRGYNEEGFYVYDPGRRGNNEGVIPYEAFDLLNMKRYRVPNY